MKDANAQAAVRKGRKHPTDATLRAEFPQITVSMRGGSFLLTMDFPSPAWMAALTPHAEGHWRGKAKVTAALRRDAALAASDLRTETWLPASIVYRFYFPDRIRRDEANMVQRMKPVIDGLVDAGVIHGDHWMALSTEGIHSAMDKDRPRIEIEIRPAKECV